MYVSLFLALSLLLICPCQTLAYLSVFVSFLYPSFVMCCLLHLPLYLIYILKLSDLNSIFLLPSGCFENGRPSITDFLCSFFVFLISSGFIFYFAFSSLPWAPLIILSFLPFASYLFLWTLPRIVQEACFPWIISVSRCSCDTPRPADAPDVNAPARLAGVPSSSCLEVFELAITFSVISL